jgi:hypothetical protein
MNRKDFLKRLGLGGISLPLLAFSNNQKPLRGQLSEDKQSWNTGSEWVKFQKKKFYKYNSWWCGPYVNSSYIKKGDVAFDSSLTGKNRFMVFHGRPERQWAEPVSLDELKLEYKWYVLRNADGSPEATCLGNFLVTLNDPIKQIEEMCQKAEKNEMR